MTDEQANILLVDSDPVNSEVVLRLLGEAGHSVVVAASSADALRAAEDCAPRVVVLHARGALANISSFISLLPTHPSLRATPVVLLGHPALPPGTMPQRIVQLPTPCEPRALLGAVLDCLAGPAGPDSSPAATPGETTHCPTQRGKSFSERLASATVHIQEEERRKLSLELHDEIAQLLGNLILMIDASMAIAPRDDRRLQQYLSDARKSAKEGFRRVQRFSVELRPPILDDLGLTPTIVWYTERFTRETSIPIELVLPDRLPPLDGDQQTALFRIMQEALHNVRKHAHARQATVIVALERGGLRLTVTDDGVGFTPDEVEEKMAEGIHLGLAGMRYRAGLLGGTVDVVSADGKGTSVVTWMPLAELGSLSSSLSTH